MNRVIDTHPALVPFSTAKLGSTDLWLRLGLGAVLLGGALSSLGSTLANPDLWGYLAFGRLFWQSQHFPFQDIFSFAPTLHPWVYHEWLTGVLFYPLYQAWDAAGLQILKYGCGLGTLLVLYLTARLRGANFFGAVITLWVLKSFLAIGFSSVRAQVFTYGFFALTLYLLENARVRERWQGLWLVIPLQVLWCNLHGGFVAGLGLIGIFAVGEAMSQRRFWPYAGILALSGLATRVNPYGLQYWHYLLRALTMPRPDITEWISVYMAFQTCRFLDTCFYFVQVVIVAALLLWWTRWRDLTSSLALLLTLCLGLMHLRHIVFFLLLAGAYVPVALTAFLAALTTQPSWLRLTSRLGKKTMAALILVPILIYGHNLSHQSPLGLETPARPQKGNNIYYPLGAVDFIKRHHLTGNLLCDFNWGEYLLWTLYPQCLVAMDGRYETVYPEAYSRRFFDFIRARGDWQKFLWQYQPDMLLIKIRSPVYARLQQSPWRQVYADSGCALFLRQDMQLK